MKDRLIEPIILRVTTMRLRIYQIWKRWRNVILTLLLLAAVTISSAQLSLVEPSVPLSALKPFSLAGYHRLLIFAPHSDDETLGTGGLILAARRAGIQVKVVMLTNGDGFLFATIRDFKRIYPRHFDFVRLGEMRQQETLAALRLLGVSSSQVDFLSYPDRGTPELWDTYWSPGHPFRSPYNGDSKSPYPITYDPKSVYAGADVLGDIQSILDSYQPDLVVYPHPDDVHPDHWGLSVFVRLALTLEEHSHPDFHPFQLTYLVHRPDYPDLRGLRPQAALTPPIALYDLSQDWYRLDMPAADTALKGQAILKYHSQLTLLRSFMESFVRANELFAPVQDAVLPVLAQGNPNNPSTWLEAGEQVIKPIQRDPAGDFITRTALPPTDLVATYAARDSANNLLVCVEARENAVPALVYSLRMKVLSSKGIMAFQAQAGDIAPGWQPARRSGRFVCVSTRLADLGNPWAVYIGANVVGGGRTIDEVAWQMVQIPER